MSRAGILAGYGIACKPPFIAVKVVNIGCGIAVALCHSAVAVQGKAVVALDDKIKLGALLRSEIVGHFARHFGNGGPCGTHDAHGSLS